MTRNLSLACLALVSLIASCGGSETKRPNVLLITMDTTRPDYLGTYGRRPDARTPSLDALAAEGTRFDKAMSASAVTPVSHASIVTGEFPYHHGLRVLHADGGFTLPREHASVAQTLKDAGYHTGAVHSAFPVSRFFGFQRGFDSFQDMNGEMEERADPRPDEPGEMRTGWDTTGLQRRSDHTTDLAIDYIDESLEAGDAPFFLWVHYWDPHDPILRPPLEYTPGVTIDAEGKPSRWGDSEYAAEVRFMDEQIGRLFAEMKKRGVWENTTIVVTADHGEGLSDGLRDHQWFSHRMVYEEQVQVPLLVRTPGPSGQQRAVVPELVRTVDIVPTLLDYCGLESPRALDGLSLRPLMEGRPSEPRIGYADQINGYDANAKMVEKRPDATFLYCVTDGRWKLTYRPHAPNQSELFDLSSDPDELVNLIGRQPDITQRLLADLAVRNPWVLSPFPPDSNGEEGMREKLENMGYAGADGLHDVNWKWTCPKHPEQRLDERARCPECESILVPVRGQ